MRAPRGGPRGAWAWALTLAAGMAVAAPPQPAQAPPAGEIRILNAETYRLGEVYHLNAAIRYRLSRQALEALANGLPLVFEVTAEVVRPRPYLWDETVAVVRQRYRLVYRALTDRYEVTHLNTGVQTRYPSLEMALAALGRVVGVPLLDAGLLEPGERYLVRLQARLDVESLPVPLRVLGYFSPGWRLASPWRTWPLR
ncbi:MAG: DUF4390 domain-containing protein [Gammaproteobacteria bacterium]|nr:MAG: DUF4390 domain-containing protein [Gammaproteobacteria bacterium]